MTRMLQSMKHRGPDSTGYALYRPTPRATSCASSSPTPTAHDFEFAERAEPPAGADRGAASARRGAQIHSIDASAEHAMTLTFDYDGDLKELADYVEDVRGVEVLSLGHSLEIVKDLGDAETVAADYDLDDFFGTHGIGHVRMATESDVDIANAHPYWAYPFSDVAVVHNGQLTNYHQWRRRLERAGHRFQSECDSEIIAVYLAERMAKGDSLEDAMRRSLDGARRRVHLHLRDRGRARAWPRTSSRPSRSCSTSPTTSSRSPPRRSRSARSWTARSRPTTRTRAR